ncbi:MAG: putative membrane protein [Saprospiraceae bacterium]|jgi:putative membrane protein
MTEKIQVALKGMAMGIAEVIPGVSGGTIAFITGIYEKLLNSIKAFGPELFPIFRKEGFAGIWKAIDGTFLLSLLFGMALGIVIGVFGVTHLLENYPPAIWAFFFGLIIGSVIYVGKQVERWDWKTIVLLIIGAVVAYSITVLTPAEGSTNLLFVFLCGMLAISALILPGISGSFILLMLGMYTYIVSDTLKVALKTFAMEKLMVMAVFALGCLTGLMSVSRLLSWTFKYYRSATLAVLTGFMIGSLNKIWPWRNAVEWLRDASGNIIMEEGLPKKILIEENVFPAGFDGAPLTMWVVLFAIIGFAVVFLLEKLDKK